MATSAAAQDGWMARAALRSAAWAEKWFPDAYVFAVLGVMALPFYLDCGFSKTEIAAVSKLFGVWVGIAGAFIGGAAVVRFGAHRMLLVAMLASWLAPDTPFEERTDHEAALGRILFGALGQLRGSALKMSQLLSMHPDLLPEAKPTILVPPPR